MSEPASLTREEREAFVEWAAAVSDAVEKVTTSDRRANRVRKSHLHLQETFSPQEEETEAGA